MSASRPVGVHEPQLGAIFAEHSDAEAAVEDLRRLGLVDEHLGVAVRQPEGYVFEREGETEVAHGVGKGIALGAPIGAVAGMIVLALAGPGAAAVGLGGLLATGAVTGATAGGFWGAYLGLSAEKHVLEEERDWERTDLRPGEVLVVVCQHGDPDQFREVIARHGGRVVSKPAHID